MEIGIRPLLGQSGGGGTPPSAEDVERWQKEDAERRSKKRDKKRGNGWKQEDSAEVPPYTVVGNAGQATSNSGFAKGAVNVGSVPKPPR